MVNWRGRLAVLLSSVALIALTGVDTGTGFAAVTGTGTTTQQSTDTPGASTTPAHVTAGACHYYVAPGGRFGHSCNGALTGETVRTIINNIPAELPTCWDILMTPGDLDDYDLTPPAAGAGYVYAIHECVHPSDFTLDDPPSYQPNLQINEIVIEIEDPQAPCPTPYDNDVMQGHCVMTLTPVQHSLVDPTASSTRTVPGVLIVRHPTTIVRTNEAVSYSDEQGRQDGVTPDSTATQTINGSQMWAAITDYRIYPYGKGAATGAEPCTLGRYQVKPLRPEDMQPGVCKECTGTASVTQQDTPDSVPDACWWAYTQSSAVVPQTQTYPLLSQATWSVYYNTGGGTADHLLSKVQEYDTTQLSVLDVQSVVIGTGGGGPST